MDCNMTLTGPEILNHIFVPRLSRQFREEVELTNKFENLMLGMGGCCVIDHAATRTADPKVFQMIIDLAELFGLVPHAEYYFPSKKLKAIDLQNPNENGFKWFSTLVDVERFDVYIQKVIMDDLEISRPSFNEKCRGYMQILSDNGSLKFVDATDFIDELFSSFFMRNGDPIHEETVQLLRKHSQETLNALVLGPAFNHIAYSINSLNIKDWYGTNVIDVLYQYLKDQGFTMIDGVQGSISGPLRQTSTIADQNGYNVQTQNGLVSMQFPSKFIEFIERKTENGSMFENNKIKLFQGFIAENAAKIYDSTKIKI